MRTSLVRFLICGTLVAGCGPASTSPPPAPGTPTGGSGVVTGGVTGTGGGTGGTSATGGATGGGTGGASGTGGSVGGGETDAGAPPTTSDDGGVPPGGSGAFPLCPRCTNTLFDGKSFDGWELSPPEAFAVHDGVFASTGKVAGNQAHAWTKQDFGDYRIFYTVRQVKDGHKPCTIMFGERPAAGKAPGRGMFGIQFQPPRGGSWDYRPGKGGEPYMSGRKEWMYPEPRPVFDSLKWNRCEVLVRASKGSFNAACCEIEGKDSCKGIPVLRYEDATIGKKAPFAIMMHNGGLMDEYKDFWIETDPETDELLSTK
jgi:hypothetical protein